MGWSNNGQSILLCVACTSCESESLTLWSLFLPASDGWPYCKNSLMQQSAHSAFPSLQMMNCKQWCGGICKGEGFHVSDPVHLVIFWIFLFCTTNNKMTFPNKYTALRKDYHLQEKGPGMRKSPPGFSLSFPPGVLGPGSPDPDYWCYQPVSRLLHSP